jgi:hypothetical protein
VIAMEVGNISYVHVVKFPSSLVITGPAGFLL